MGVQGGEAPWQGAWGMCPQNKKRERVAHLSDLPTSGTQNAGKPSAHGGGQRGVEGAKPHPRGFGGCAPKNIKIRGELPTLAAPPRVGPKVLANPKPTGVGKRGVEGAKPHPRGFGGCAPKNIKIRGELPTLAAPPRVGPKTLANPKPTGVGNWGSRGRSLMAGGMGGAPPQNLKRGELPTLAAPPRVGPKVLANPKPTGVGNWGSRGRSPMGPSLPPTEALR